MRRGELLCVLFCLFGPSCNGRGLDGDTEVCTEKVEAFRIWKLTVAQRFFLAQQQLVKSRKMEKVADYHHEDNYTKNTFLSMTLVILLTPSLPDDLIVVAASSPSSYHRIMLALLLYHVCLFKGYTPQVKKSPSSSLS